MNKLILLSSLFLYLPAFASANCPEWLDHTLPKLHSSSNVKLCDIINNKAVLLFNSASYCGFTHQLGELQKLHERYIDKGLVLIGFPSHDFQQEASSDETIASICYENFGVTFTMVSPIQVKGDGAHPIFKYLASHSLTPTWNFNKYLISPSGKHIKHFPSSVSPSDSTIIEAINQFTSRL